MSESATRRSETGLEETFRRDGFVAVPGLFGEEEMRRISAWTDELGALPEVPGRCMMYFEPSLLRPGERVLQRIENFCPFHAGFAALCDGLKLRGTVSRLFGEPAVLFKDKINFKLPGGDGLSPIRTSRPAGAPTPTCSSPPWSASTRPPPRTAAWISVPDNTGRDF